MKKVIYRTDFLKPSLTVDLVVLGYQDNELFVLLIRRLLEPFKDLWALPGGFVLGDETLAQAAKRELEEETGVSEIHLEQLHTFDEPGRDPRGRVITVAHLALVKPSLHLLKPSGDATEAKWFKLHELPVLAFDHRAILKAGIERIKNKIRHEPLAFELLPKEFTLTHLQELLELILEEKLDKRNFRKKVIDLNLLEEIEFEVKTPYRRPQYYEFRKDEFKKRMKDGFRFEL
jgi:8-oxo-dGTP diphosphatase